MSHCRQGRRGNLLLQPVVLNQAQDSDVVEGGNLFLSFNGTMRQNKMKGEEEIKGGRVTIFIFLA